MIHPIRIHSVRWCWWWLFFVVFTFRPWTWWCAAAAWWRRRAALFLHFLFARLFWVTEDAVAWADACDAQGSLLLDVAWLDDQVCYFLLVQLASEVKSFEVSWRLFCVSDRIFRLNPFEQCFQKANTFNFSLRFEKLLLFFVNFLRQLAGFFLRNLLDVLLLALFLALSLFIEKNFLNCFLFLSTN